MIQMQNQVAQSFLNMTILNIEGRKI